MAEKKSESVAREIKHFEHMLERSHGVEILVDQDHDQVITVYHRN